MVGLDGRGLAPEPGPRMESITGIQSPRAGLIQIGNLEIEADRSNAETETNEANHVASNFCLG
ncbi:MAG: hypothetical protein CL908_14150 [Deltaproteobacteria bacterium]|nr:hypothetical protein [Deltaproteobacteria bacterium]